MKYILLIFVLIITGQQLFIQNLTHEHHQLKHIKIFNETFRDHFIIKSVEKFTEDFNNLKEPEPLVSFEDYKKLTLKVEKHRQKRLVNLETFIKMSKQTNVIILDTRAEDLYKRRHIKGAINLPFTKFTQANLMRVIPNWNTKVLIYCNNNIKNDQILFASKVALPRIDNPTMMALNIPTYINLYGYGYRNIYELNDIVDIFESRIDSTSIQFEGSAF